MRNVLRGLAWTLLTIIVVLSLVPPEARPVTGMMHIVEHAAIFLLTGAVFALAYEDQVGFLFISALIFSGVLELIQSYVPGRHARLSDALVDAVTACIGVAAAWVALRLPRFKKNASD